nr:hypothetical protein [Tanacetum cinerariifolium]
MSLKVYVFGWRTMHDWRCLNIGIRFLSSEARGRDVKEKEKQGMASVNNHVMKVNGSYEASTVGIKGPILTKNTKGSVSFAKLGFDEPSRKKVKFRTLLPRGTKDFIDVVKDYYCCWSSLKKTKWCSSCKVCGHCLDDRDKNIVSDVLKNMKNHKQAVRGVQVGPKLRFKLTKQVYEHVSKNNGASASGMNEKNLKLAEKGANYGVVYSNNGISFESFGSPTATPLVENINNLERQLMDRKLVLVDDEGKS